jgi:biofilm PGA synthesis protein PgaA
VAYAARDIEASLQARRFGITADSLAAAAVWTPSDGTWLRIGASQFRYDDGNRREQVGVDAAQRLLARPHWLVDGLAGASVSRGSLGEDAQYFNPERDASASLGLRIENISWRRYERHFRQRLELGAGSYWQRDFGQHWVPSAAYRHLWRFATGHAFEYGIAWSRPVYDGNREQRIGLDMAWRWGDGR